MWHITATNILFITLFSAVYLLIQQIRKIFVHEADYDLYHYLIDEILLCEYLYVCVGAMLAPSFSNFEVFISFFVVLLVRYLYKTFIHDSIKRSFSNRIKNNNKY